jgi:hypothetical protein
VEPQQHALELNGARSRRAGRHGYRDDREYGVVKTDGVVIRNVPAASMTTDCSHRRSALGTLAGSIVCHEPAPAASSSTTSNTVTVVASRK